MRKRFGILFTVALIAILGVVCLIFLHPQETVYQGKEFAFWLDRYCWNFRDESSNGIRERHQAEAAMRQIGTNGIPVLLEMIRARNSHWREKANALAREQSLSSLHLSQADDHYAAAVQGFIVLGSNAAPAVPALIDLLNDSDPGVRGAAASALGAIKPAPEQAVPALVQHLNETDEFALLNIVRALGDIHRKPEVVVPALIKNLESSNGLPASIGALAQFGDAARPAFPTIVSFLVHPDAGFRWWATNGLKQIDPKAAFSLGVQ